ncbi:Caleosin-related family protein [Arabidopsis thaliana]|uniref:Caleosin-related family protein n=1 Tax=Arabidopsis thaliana TaxID=3702 RepID=A0A1P8AN27_ARATH|nr:Caleosin-related family protein [Arabidopsis thaliana]ANM58061.1 Caleosin-related family protein [Arabidopsis thaliana]|eukprot:NP_001320525.1 Caleosin-related family protein [Arabidopsis thaliana]
MFFCFCFCESKKGLCMETYLWDYVVYVGGKLDKEKMTALEKHVSFFDRNKDGTVYPWETYQGFRALGTGRLLAAFVAIFINMGLSKKTRPGKGFSPLFPIDVKNSHLCMHGSDTDVYDDDGRFVESKFEEIFNKHARTHKDALTAEEIQKMLKTNRDPFDITGWLSDYGEWKILHTLAQDKNGLLSEKSVRAIYDGSLFHQLEKKRSSSSSRGKKQKLP